MRIIIVSDSHGFGLGDAITRQDRTVDIMTIAVRPLAAEQHITTFSQFKLTPFTQHECIK